MTDRDVHLRRMSWRTERSSGQTLRSGPAPRVVVLAWGLGVAVLG